MSSESQPAVCPAVNSVWHLLTLWAHSRTTDKLLRRYKDENVKIKAQTASLQGELDAIRGTNSSEAGARTREVTGRNTPTIDDTPETLRKQLVDSQRQLYQLNKISQENQTLTAESADLRAEVAKLKDAYTQELDESHARVTELEKELLRLQQAAPDARQLKTDLAAVRSENAELRQRVQHLLDSQTYNGDEPRAGDDDDPDHAELQRCVPSCLPDVRPKGNVDADSPACCRYLATSARSRLRLALRPRRSTPALPMNGSRTGRSFLVLSCEPTVELAACAPSPSLSVYELILSHRGSPPSASRSRLQGSVFSFARTFLIGRPFRLTSHPLRTLYNPPFPKKHGFHRLLLTRQKGGV
jgi:cell division protein FtsB